jgi:RIO kinase 1
MEVVVDAHGHPAPRLVDAPIAREQAAGIYASVRRQAVGMLSCGLIHGDLSPYNVLLGSQGPVVIDLPQVVDAAHNSQAEKFFLRDLEGIRRFCLSIDPTLPGEGDGREIWQAYVRRELSADFVPTGRAPPPRREERPAAGQGGHAGHGGHGGHPGRGGHGGRGGHPGRGGPRQQGRGKPAATPPGPQRQEPRRPDTRGARNVRVPEVIRVERLPHGKPVAASPGPPLGTPRPPGTPRPDGTPRHDGAPGRRRRRRRRRGGV